MWSYEPVSDLWPDMYPDSDYNYYESSDEGRKYQENPDDQEQEEVVLVPRGNPINLRQSDQRALRHL